MQGAVKTMIDQATELGQLKALNTELMAALSDGVSIVENYIGRDFESRMRAWLIQACAALSKAEGR